MWVGCWNLLAYWAWPWAATLFVERDVMYFCLGAALKFIGVVWVPEDNLPSQVAQEWEGGMPPTWDWGRRLRHFWTRMLHFMAFLFMWVGAWNFFDLYLYNCGYCWERELYYIAIPTVVLFFTQEGLSKDSLYWLFTRARGRIPDAEDPSTPLSKNGKGPYSYA